MYRFDRGGIAMTDMRPRKAPKTYYIKTYGCQMNVRDSETIAGIFEGLGLSPAQDMTEADVILVNTCTVRDKAEQKVYGLLGR
ncbi:MAG: hypothetical protein PHP52_13765, partial [Bacteroidales bacterium]|nr:hypothetical protein [Bacteroidales bacterium]